ncbi:oxidative stress-responsive serine-rich protein 1 isoform X3 [Salmo trutta]|uniref:Oxidative stress-responsive serine-rich protein 1 n=1 Tax=Salmo trutta TaxID=8032 RepID=A0A674C4Q6_SALTR|nr:oxidative stress-responsive serine-rich protein 1 isoform X3 [Salmo trutta]XP_029550939.1 oxidative stress-responsive serine-rich protein 1 isoform X3 [Salmo trutta]
MQLELGGWSLQPPPTMEAGGKDCEDETLQTAFKKLRVDAESLPATLHVCETITPRVVSRAFLEGAKPKLSCPKENWHGSCMRKTSRGAVRSQRRRRSKSPILHPPKFTYCGSKMSPLPGHLKHKSLPEAEGCSSSLEIPAKKELLSSGHSSPVFGSAGYEPHTPAASGEGPTARLEGSPRRPLSDDKGVPEAAHCVGAEAKTGAVPSDFRSLSKLHEGGGPCPCAQSECQCPGWQGVEVYSFTGLRNILSECERNLASPEDTSQTSLQQRTQTDGSTTTTSPRSCSEQARAYVDDITIEDLSGYMEYYLYIPKKMSHMAEMMYT